MNFEPENYSRRALLWFAAVIDIAVLGRCFRRDLGYLHGY